MVEQKGRTRASTRLSNAAGSLGNYPHCSGSGSLQTGLSCDRRLLLGLQTIANSKQRKSVEMEDADFVLFSARARVRRADFKRRLRGQNV